MKPSAVLSTMTGSLVAGFSRPQVVESKMRSIPDLGDESEEETEQLHNSVTNNPVPVVNSGVAPSPLNFWLANIDNNTGDYYYWDYARNAPTWDVPENNSFVGRLFQEQTMPPEWALEPQPYQYDNYFTWETENQVLNERTTRNPLSNTDEINNPSTSGYRNRTHGDVEGQIELINHYCTSTSESSESDSNDETDAPGKASQSPLKVQPTKNVVKKSKTTTQQDSPHHMTYPVPIGPELPPELHNTVGNTSVATQESVTMELSNEIDQGALSVPYRQHGDDSVNIEPQAAPPGWTCAFNSSEHRYYFRRESDGFEQWEYPATEPIDMDICVTPPLTAAEQEEQEIAQKLASFYQDITESENKEEIQPMSQTPSTSIELAEPAEQGKLDKKTVKVKIYKKAGMDTKSASLVARWKQVAEESDSD